MNFNKHSTLGDMHAYLGGSKYHWINYDEDKLASSYKKYLAVRRGTQLHEFASKCISLQIKLPRNKKALNSYVNDAIAFQMVPEQPLFYSMNAFGTADAISFKRDFLRVHDLKTGISPVSMNQLMIYAALFCLEYDVPPEKIDIELRIYQNEGYIVENPDPNRIMELMDKIIVFDELIEKMKTEEGLWLES